MGGAPWAPLLEGSEATRQDHRAPLHQVLAGLIRSDLTDRLPLHVGTRIAFVTFTASGGVTEDEVDDLEAHLGGLGLDFVICIDTDDDGTSPHTHTVIIDPPDDFDWPERKWPGPGKWPPREEWPSLMRWWCERTGRSEPYLQDCRYAVTARPPNVPVWKHKDPLFGLLQYGMRHLPLEVRGGGRASLSVRRALETVSGLVDPPDDPEAVRELEERLDAFLSQQTGRRPPPAPAHKSWVSARSPRVCRWCNYMRRDGDPKGERLKPGQRIHRGCESAARSALSREAAKTSDPARFKERVLALELPRSEGGRGFLRRKAVRVASVEARTWNLPEEIEERPATVVQTVARKPARTHQASYRERVARKAARIGLWHLALLPSDMIRIWFRFFDEEIAKVSSNEAAISEAWWRLGKAAVRLGRVRDLPV